MTLVAIKFTLAIVIALSVSYLVNSFGNQHSIAQVNSNQTNASQTYNNPDLGLSMQYPPSWIKQTDNLKRNTIVAFQLKEDRFHNSLNFANVTLAEIDVRIYPAAQNQTSANLNIGDTHTEGQALIKQYKNSTTTLGGLPALKIVSYLFGSLTEKALQVWTYVPSKHVLLEVTYIVQPSQYSLYLPAVQQIMNSIKIK
jgi:hypothetical protein